MTEPTTPPTTPPTTASPNPALVNSGAVTINAAVANPIVHFFFILILLVL